MNADYALEQGLLLLFDGNKKAYRFSPIGFY